MPFINKHNLTRYIVGKGVEVGALNNPLKVKRRKADVLYADLIDMENLVETNPETPASDIRRPDIVADAESMDFAIACHVLEHLPNPLKALKALKDLKPGGIFYLSLPDKRYSLDRERPITSLSHVIKDYEEGTTSDKCADHYHEWLELVELKKDMPVAKSIEEVKRYRIHFHVWEPGSVLEILNYMGDSMGICFELKDYFHRRGDLDVVLVLEKKASTPCSSLPLSLVKRYSPVRGLLHRIASAIKYRLGRMRRAGSFCA